MGIKIIARCGVVQEMVAARGDFLLLAVEGQKTGPVLDTRVVDCIYSGVSRR